MFITDGPKGNKQENVREISKTDASYSPKRFIGGEEKKTDGGAVL